MPILVSDLDGTLLDVRDRFIHAQINALADFGYTVTIEQVSPLTEFTMDYKQFLGGLDVQLSQEDLIHYFLRIEQEFYKGWQYSYVFPGVIEALKEIRPRVDALRLITSRAWVEETRDEVNHFGLDILFDRQVVTRGDLARAEGVQEVPLYPFLDHRQRLIQLAIADLETPNDVWVIGDSPNEMEAAQRLGYTSVGVLTGFYTPEALDPYCTHVLNSVADIDTLL
ncbi:HAD family hydrolase [Candidatus Bathyarchaeota archaeon]|nr:HAD family hydrolase [Candidatus Bathyarchaeota archaeon]